MFSRKLSRGLCVRKFLMTFGDTQVSLHIWWSEKVWAIHWTQSTSNGKSFLFSLSKYHWTNNYIWIFCEPRQQLPQTMQTTITIPSFASRQSSEHERWMQNYAPLFIQITSFFEKRIFFLVCSIWIISCIWMQ